MSKVSPVDVEKMISSYASIVDFGSSSDAVGEEWIAKAETVLGRPLTDSYKWFLNTYVGGEIEGEEIYSLYGTPFESTSGCDIVVQHLLNRKQCLFDDSMLVVSVTDLDEVFFFDYNHLQGKECPLYLLLPSGESVFYAADFYDFLCKRISAHAH
jgi:hypothetical protein